MTVEANLNEWLKQPGTFVSAAEWEFISDMRKARARHVGYGWMQQVIEWEWQTYDPVMARGPQDDENRACAASLTESEKTLIEEIDLRFQSGNTVPVERVSVRASEWERIKGALRRTSHGAF